MFTAVLSWSHLFPAVRRRTGEEPTNSGVQDHERRPIDRVWRIGAVIHNVLFAPSSTLGGHLNLGGLVQSLFGSKNQAARTRRLVNRRRHAVACGLQKRRQCKARQFFSLYSGSGRRWWKTLSSIRISPRQRPLSCVRRRQGFIGEWSVPDGELIEILLPLEIAQELRCNVVAAKPSPCHRHQSNASRTTSSIAFT